MANDFDITLSANIEFKEAELSANLTSAIKTIFSDQLNGVFEEVGKTIAESFLKNIGQDYTITANFGRSIAESHAKSFQDIARRRGPQMLGGDYYTPQGAGSYASGRFGFGGQQYGTTSDILSSQRTAQEQRRLEEAQIGQTALGPLSQHLGGGLWNKIFEGDQASTLTGKAFKGFARWRGDKGGGGAASEIAREVPPAGTLAEAQDVWAAGGEAMGTAGEMVQGAGVLGEAAIGESAAAMAATVGAVAAPILAVALPAMKMYGEYMMGAAKTYGEMIGGPGISGAAAYGAASAAMVGFEKIPQVVGQLAQSGLEIDELNASVGQATKSIYGYGMSAETTAQYLTYQYEELGTSVGDTTQQMANLAGAAALSGMSVTAFANMAMQAATRLQASGFGEGSMQAGISVSSAIRTQIPGQGATEAIISQMPKTPIAWQAAATRLGVPVSQIGPRMLGGSDKDQGLGYVYQEAKYARGIFGANTEMGVQYLMTKFPGLDMEQAAQYYQMGAGMTQKGFIGKLQGEQKRAANIESMAAQEAESRRGGIWGFIGKAMKVVPGLGGASDVWTAWRETEAGKAQEAGQKLIGGREAKYGTAAPLVGAGGGALETQELTGGGLQATKAGMVVRIEPSKEYKATVHDYYDEVDSVNRSRSGGLP